MKCLATFFFNLSFVYYLQILKQASVGDSSITISPSHSPEKPQSSTEDKTSLSSKARQSQGHSKGSEKDHNRDEQNVAVTSNGSWRKTAAPSSSSADK